MNCPINSNWMKKTMGEKIFQDIKTNNIICCGTVIANFHHFLEYANIMDNMKFFENFI